MNPETFLDGRVELHAGDCREMIRTLAEGSIDSAVTDPPYALVSIVKRFGKPGAAPAKGNEAYARASAGFMGKAWDTGEVAFDPAFWAEVLRVLKPGAHLVAFGGTRSYHRLAAAIEDAGFEIRDQLAWVYGSGFPKSLDVSKAIDKAAGADREVVGIAGRSGSRRSCMAGDFAGGEYMTTLPITDAAREWSGWGTALKPAWEPIVLARKPLAEGSVSANVLAHGTGAINIDGCRITAPDGLSSGGAQGRMPQPNDWQSGSQIIRSQPHHLGRWPANIVHDGSDDVVEAFPAQAGAGGAASGPSLRGSNTSVARGKFNGLPEGRGPAFHADSGSAARFFYSAKADSDDRLGSKHPTVKPVDLMQWLVRLVTPKGGTVLDPFAGTGTTGEAAVRENCRAVLIEREDEYRADIHRRMTLALSGPAERRRESMKARAPQASDTPLAARDAAGQTSLFDVVAPPAQRAAE